MGIHQQARDGQGQRRGHDRAEHHEAHRPAQESRFGALLDPGDQDDIRVAVADAHRSGQQGGDRDTRREADPREQDAHDDDQAEDDRAEAGRARQRAAEARTRSDRRRRQPNRTPSIGASPSKWMSTSQGMPTTIGPVKARLKTGDRSTSWRISGSPRTVAEALDEGGPHRGVDGSRRSWQLVAVDDRPRQRPRVGRLRMGRLGRVAPVWTSHRAIAATTKVRASKAKAAATPMIAIAKPAIAGPIVPISWVVPWSRPLAGGQSLAGHEPGDEGVDGRIEDRVDGSERDPEQHQVPDLDPVAEDQRRDRGGQDRADDVRGEDQRARRDAVGEHPADEHEDAPRDGGRHQDRAERKPRIRSGPGRATTGRRCGSGRR